VTFGATDKIAAYPVSNPVSIQDIGATIYHCLGIDPATRVLDLQGRPVEVGCGGTPLRTRPAPTSRTGRSRATTSGPQCSTPSVYHLKPSSWGLTALPAPSAPAGRSSTFSNHRLGSLSRPVRNGRRWYNAALSPAW
jgi:hypothetical protein